MTKKSYTKLEYDFDMHTDECSRIWVPSKIAASRQARIENRSGGCLLCETVEIDVPAAMWGSREEANRDIQEMCDAALAAQTATK